MGYWLQFGACIFFFEYKNFYFWKSSLKKFVPIVFLRQGGEQASSGEALNTLSEVQHCYGP